MLYAEAVGHTSYRGTWMCVTDGGHYDNLGLVEALQRAPELGITHILVLDASGDKADTWFTLGGSIALARADAATDITINPMTMTTPRKRNAPELGSGEVVCPWAKGTFTRHTPGGTGTVQAQDGAEQTPDGTGRVNTIVVCKLGWWTGRRGTCARTRRSADVPDGFHPGKALRQRGVRRLPGTWRVLGRAGPEGDPAAPAAASAPAERRTDTCTTARSE